MWSAIFPGQGSQFVGMSQFLFDNFSFVRHRFEEASDTLGLDFKKLCFMGPKEDLEFTPNTQPALLLCSVVTHEVVMKTTGVRFCAASGHSVGEYAALVTSGALDFVETLKTVKTRGELMQAAVPRGHGAMLAVIGPTDQQVCDLCQWAEKTSGMSPLEPANFNSPGQVVVSGIAPLTQWLQENWSLFDQPSLRQIKLIPLKVSAPFHCSLMRPAEEKMKPVLQAIKFTDSPYPIVQNAVAKPVTQKEALRIHLITQISTPVRWTDCVNQLKVLGTKKFLELGPGKTLSQLIKKTDKEENIQTFNISSLEDLKALENDS